MGSVKAPEKAEPPTYTDAAPPTSSDTSPPVYDFADSDTQLGAADEKKRLAAAEKPTSESLNARPSTSSSRASLSQTSWQLSSKSPASSTLVVQDVRDSTPLYYIHRSTRQPQIRLQSASTGQQIGLAHYLAYSREVEIDMHAVRGVGLHAVGNNAKSYTYSSPALMRRLRWTRHGLWGHMVRSMECRDERDDEVAAWSMQRLSTSGRLAKVEFARWVDAGDDEVVRRRKEEILLLGAVMHFKKSVAEEGLHKDEPERDMKDMTFL